MAWQCPGKTRLRQDYLRFILRISAWSVAMLVVCFLSVYTILLMYVNQRFPSDKDHVGARVISKYKKKFHGRFPLAHNSAEAASIQEKLAALPTFWNSSDFYSDDLLPQCWQGVLFRILVTSSLDNKNRRNSIRQTWCNPEKFGYFRNTWQCIFLVGKSESKSSSSHLKREITKFQDILVGDYFDSYRNLTLKVVHGFNWSVNHCPSTFVVKTDDDCFVNAGALYNFLTNHNQKVANLYAGRIVTDKRKLHVVRTREKWSVSYKDYSAAYYPPYASGIGYILSMDVIERLVTMSEHIKPFPNEDAYVGVVMSKLAVSYTTTRRFSMSSRGLSVCNFLYVFLIHDVSPQQHHELMVKALAAPKNCSHLTPITTWE